MLGRNCTNVHTDATRLALDELVVVTWTHDPAPRQRSYELLAEAFGLAAPQAAPG